MTDRDRLTEQFEAVLPDSVGLALRAVLESLSPEERLAFVLHDLVAEPFEAIAPKVECTPTETRELASRARRRVQGANAWGDVDIGRRRELVDAFLAESRRGGVDALLAVLDRDVVLRADDAAIASGVPATVRGAPDVATTFAGRARVAHPALIDGAVGLVWAHHGELRVAFDLTVRNGKIAAIDLIADPEHLRALDVVALDEQPRP